MNKAEVPLAQVHPTAFATWYQMLAVIQHQVTWTVYTQTTISVTTFAAEEDSWVHLNVCKQLPHESFKEWHVFGGSKMTHNMISGIVTAT